MTATGPVPETFVCAACHGTFPKGWSDEEALAESVDVFGVALPAEDQAVVCDDCYKQMMAWGEANGALDQERARLRNKDPEP